MEKHLLAGKRLHVENLPIDRLVDYLLKRTGGRFQDLVPAILGYLGARNLALLGLINRPARAGAGVEVRLGGLSEMSVEDVARGLAALPGLDWVAYRYAGRAGGVFSAHTPYRSAVPVPETSVRRDPGPTALIA